MKTYRKYKTDADKVKVYEHRLNQAEQQNEKWHVEANKAWARYEGQTRSTAMSADGHNVSGSTPVFIGTIDSLYSSLTAAEIAVVLTPKGQGTDDQAYVGTAALEQEWEATKTPERGNAAIKDALLVGAGWVKVGYEFYEEENEVPRPREDVIEEVNRMLEEAAAAGDNAPDAMQVMNSVPLTATEMVTLSDRVVVDYVPWDMVLLDPTAKRFGDSRWIAQKQYMTVAEVQGNPLFQEYVRSRRNGKKLDDLKADTSIEKGILGQLADPSDEDERVTVYTVYDFETGNCCTYAKGSDFLLYESVNPFSFNEDVEDQSPFVPIILRKTARRIRGVSETDAMKTSLDELDIYHSRLATYLERMAPKYLAKSRAFTPSGKEAVKSQEYGAVIELEEGFEPADVQDLKPPALMQEMFEMPAKIEQSIYNAVGSSELMRGLFPDRKRTATETTEVVTASAARQAEKRTTLEAFWSGIAQRVLQLMQAYYDKERIVRLVDDAGDVAWSWSAEDIAGSFDLEIALTPKEANSWQARRDNALANLNVLGPFAQPGPDGSSPVDVTEMLRYILTELHTPRRIIRMLLNLPEEKQQQMMEQLQAQAAGAMAGQGMVRPDMVPGPASAQALAAATNQGTIPPEILAAAQGSTPVSPEAVETVSEDIGVSGL